MSQKFRDCLGAFATAKTAAQYHGAKRRASSLSISEQFALVDNIIACRRRLVRKGVL